MNNAPSPLTRGMHFVLKFAGWYNIAAGLAMIVFYHEGYKSLGIAKPELTLPIQLVGLLVALFGVGYLMVDRKPLENRAVLRLGFWSKLLGPALALGYITSGILPGSMLAVLFFADLIYLVPFYLIDRRLGESKLVPAGNQTSASDRQHPRRAA